MMSNISVRFARLSDAEAILRVYAPYVEHTAITFEYEVPSEEEFKERIRNTQKKYPYLVAVMDGRIVGYAYVGAFVGRAAYDWAAETSIYVDENCRKSGIGRHLYERIENICTEMGILNLNACIGYTEAGDEYLNNNSAQFHEHMGYRLVGQFHKCGYKFGRWYDMIWMEKMIGEHPECPLPVKNVNAVREALKEKYGLS